MVIDDIENCGQSARVALVYEPLQFTRTAVAVLCGIGRDAVVAPVATARELRYRHDFDSVDAKILEFGQTRDDSCERSFARKGSDVQLVQNAFFKSQALPPVV